MKRILSIILVALCSIIAAKATTIHSYTTQSVLANGKWVKIRVAESGICQISYEDLQKMGLDPNSVAVYGYGGSMLSQDFSLPRIADDLCAVPVFLQKGADGVFGKGDHLLFYAQGINSWRYTGTRFIHTGDCYSLYGCYFLTSNSALQKPIETISAGDEYAYEADTYTRREVYEVDTVNLIDPTGKEGGGREFYCAPVRPGSKPLNIRFQTPNVDGSTQMTVYVDMALTGTDAAVYSVVHGEEKGSISFSKASSSNHYAKGRAGYRLMRFMPSEDNEQVLTFSLTSANESSTAYINYIELCAVCQLRMTGDQLLFRNVQHYGAEENTLYHLEGATDETMVWNITDLSHIYAVPTTRTATGLQFTASNERVQEFIAFNPSGRFAAPKAIDKNTTYQNVETQNLHGLRNIEYVVLCHPDMVEAAQKLADLHAETDGMTTAVVTSEQVYNEFSSGKPDATAYRWLMKMLYDRAEAESGILPRYLVLMGDGTYDNRKVRATSGQNTLLTYQANNSLNEMEAYATDDYFAFLADEEGLSDVQGKMRIGVGRLPVNTPDEALAIVDKISRYIHNSNHSTWRQQLIFLADDGDNNMHTRDADAAAENVRVKNPSYIVNKIFLDAYAQQTTASGEQYPLAQQRLHKLLQSGALFMNYAGHGGYNNITSEQVLTLAQIRSMKVQNPAFWMLATCNFLSFDAGERSAGEEAVLSENGGAIAVMSSCRTVYANNNAVLNNHLCNALFAHEDATSYNMRIGDATSQAKNATGADANKLPYILIGDPGLKLLYPNELEIRTEPFADTLRALSTQTIRGYVEENGEVASWYNGTIQVSMYDKLQQITTKDNDQPVDTMKRPHTYNDYPNLLFSGTAEVKDGKFAIDMLVPLDIRYNYGNGRIVLYAYDEVNDAEAVGHYEDLVIGGSSPTEVVDTIGPDIQMYLNTPGFAEGGKTHRNPRLYAKLSDLHGINTAGVGIGHDLLLIIDNDLNQTYVLNDYYIADNGSYQSGKLSYQLSSMSMGKHSISLRAWDLMNNSSTAELHFEVDTTAKPIITEATLYPSPAKLSDQITLRFETDQPDAIYTVTLRLYDWSGRLVSEATKRSEEAFTWSVSDLNVNSGLYFYQVLMEGNTGTSKASGKLLIEGQ